MNLIDLDNYASLKGKVAAIPVKVILVAAFLWFTLRNDASDPKYKMETGTILMIGCMIYSFISIFWWFIRGMGNWLLGIIVCIVAFIALFWGMEKVSEMIQLIIVILLFFGSVVLDIIRIIRLIALRRKMKSISVDASDEI